MGTCTWQIFNSPCWVIRRNLSVEAEDEEEKAHADQGYKRRSKAKDVVDIAQADVSVLSLGGLSKAIVKELKE